MDKEQAIKLLEHLAWDKDNEGNCYGEALRMAIDALRQPEIVPSIPVAWIEGKIEWLNNTDNYFAELTANIIKTMLNEWRKGQTDNVD